MVAKLIIFFVSYQSNSAYY